MQQALTGLEKVVISSTEIKNSLLQGGSPATIDELRKRFEVLLNERCKGKEDPKKLRFIIE